MEFIGNILLAVLAIFVGVISVIFGFVAMTLCLECLHLPSDAVVEVGQHISWPFLMDALYVTDHVVVVLAIALPCLLGAVMALPVFGLISSSWLANFFRFIFAIAVVVSMYLVLEKKESTMPGLLTQMNQIIACVSVFIVLMLASFFEDEDFTVGRAFVHIFGLAFQLLISCGIMYIALLVSVYMHVISTFLDLWTYIDWILSYEWKVGHYILMVMSNIQNFIFFGSSFIMGILGCIYVSRFLVPSILCRRFLFAFLLFAVAEFLLYAITDARSMNGAMVSPIEFELTIVTFLLLIPFVLVVDLESE